jgi:hypothetical protein
MTAAARQSEDQIARRSTHSPEMKERLMITSPIATTAAHALAQPSVDASALTAGRTWSLVAAALGLVAVVVGGRALTGSARHAGTGRRGGRVGLAAGVSATLIGGLIVATADGGPGTGSGVVGGVLASAIGLVGTTMAGVVLARVRRTVSEP